MPSIVVTVRFRTRATGVTHDTLAWPSISTVQHPHWPWGLQPSLAERMPSRSRRASNNEHPSSGTMTGVALSVKPKSVHAPEATDRCPSAVRGWLYRFSDLSVAGGVGVIETLRSGHDECLGAWPTQSSFSTLASWKSGRMSCIPCAPAETNCLNVRIPTR